MYKHVLYSGKFSQVQNFAEMPPDSSEEIFTVFCFHGTNALTTTPSQLMATPTCKLKEWYLKTKQRSKLVQHRPSLPLMWRPSQLRKYYDCCRGWETGLLSRKIQHCWSRLWQLKRVFSRVGILYSSRLILLYSLLFRGQTDCRDRLIPRPRPTFCRLPYCKQRKAGRGLGTRLL